MSQELARKLPATIVSMQPLPARRPAPGLVALERPIPAHRIPRAWRPDLWPWYVWAPILCTPGVLSAYVLVGLATFIAHKL